MALGLGLTFLLHGCGAGRQAGSRGEQGGPKIKGDRTLVAHSEGVEPLWIQECPARTDHTLPFCGEAQQQSSQKMACSGAYADALAKLRRFIGQKVCANLEPDGKGGYRFSIQGSESEPITLRGAWEDQRWAEEYQGPGGRTHDCYVMITYPRLEYENLVGMAGKAAADRVEKATCLHREAKDLTANGQHAQAVIRLQRAQTLIGDLKEPVITPDGSTNSTLLLEQIQADLCSCQQEASLVAKTALVVVRLIMDGKPTQSGSLIDSVRNKIKAILSGKGVRIRPGGLSLPEVEAVVSGDRQVAARTAAEKGAGLLLVIDIESEFKAKEEDICYAFARGAFRLIRTDDGRELAAADLGPVKGALFNKDDALKKSVENLCKEQLGQVVANALTKL